MSARKTSPSIRGLLAVFVLDIDGRPTLAFEADGPAEAQEISRDADLWADLAALTSDGAPLYMPNSTFGLRLAEQEEIAAFRYAVGRAPATDQPTMAFLVKMGIGQELSIPV